MCRKKYLFAVVFFGVLIMMFSSACGGGKSRPGVANASDGEPLPAIQTAAKEEKPYVVQRQEFRVQAYSLERYAIDLPLEEPTFEDKRWEGDIKNLLQRCSDLIKAGNKLQRPSGTAFEDEYARINVGIKTLKEGCDTVSYANQSHDERTLWTGFQVMLKGFAKIKN